MIQAFKDELAQGEAVLVVNPDHPAPSLVEFLGRLPVDGVWIDRDRGVGSLYTHANAFPGHGAFDFADPLAKG